MYIKYSFNPFGRTEKVTAVSRDLRTKREKYEAVHERQINRRYTDKVFIEGKYLSSKRLEFPSATEVYLNYINKNKELIYALSINTYPAYDIDDNNLGNNIDLIV